MATACTRSIALSDGDSLHLVIEEPEAGKVVAHLTRAGRTFEIVARPDETRDGEPATWRAGATDVSAAGDGPAGAVIVSDAAFVGFATSDEALEEAARQIVEVADDRDGRG